MLQAFSELWRRYEVIDYVPSRSRRPLTLQPWPLRAFVRGTLTNRDP